MQHTFPAGISFGSLFHSLDNIFSLLCFKCTQVLVDAECTHDGSIKHIQKFEFWGWKTLDRRVLDAERTDDLLHLQLRLLTNGFKLLKTGGSLVYSTCR
jgi:16S rRNA C967 or C1407 C5-methylase (RsmB/RsmF family)